MKRKRYIVAGAILVGLAILMFFWYRPWFDNYVGDGDVSRIGTSVLAPGYVVEFGALDMRKPFEKRYTFSKLPRSLSWPVFGVEVMTLDTQFSPPDEPSLDYGELSLRLTDSNGNYIFDVEAPLSEWTVFDPGTTHGLIKYEMYFMNDEMSTDLPSGRIDRGSKYELYVRYEPGEAEIVGFGLPFVRGGGYK